MSQEIQKSSKIAIFKDQQIRKIIHNDEWFFSIVDIIQILTDSSNPRRYWSDLKITLTDEEGFVQLYEKIVQLKLIAPDGKMRETDTANTEIIFRICQQTIRQHPKVKYIRYQKLKESCRNLCL